MAFLSAHRRHDLLRLLDGDVGEDEKRSLEEHLASCSECRTYLSSVRHFNEGLGELSKEEFTSQESCPDTWTLVSYEADKVDEETARHLRAHLLFCDDCREEFYVLRRLRAPSWTKLVLNLVRGAVELVSISGPGVFEPAYAAELRTEMAPPSGTLGVEDALVDPETNATSIVRLKIEAEPKSSTASMLIDAEPPQHNWRAYLYDAEDQELASMPLAARENPIASKLVAGAYTIHVRKGPDILASFVIEIHIT